MMYPEQETCDGFVFLCLEDCSDAGYKAFLRVILPCWRDSTLSTGITDHRVPLGYF